MIPARRPIFDGIELSLEEFQAILKERLVTLRLGSREGRLESDLPARWRTGYRCYWRILRRTLSGDLLLIFRVERSGYQKTVFERRVRLVRRQSLPFNVRSRVARD